LVLDIYSSLSLIWRYSYCPVFQGATSGTTSLIGIGHNMAIRLKHNSTRITARTAKHSGNHPHKEQTFIGAKVHKFSW
ncbi:hypothetical protein, partial [Klebsiella pneumoniae]